jgi:hypothetical protein
MSMRCLEDLVVEQLQFPRRYGLLHSSPRNPPHNDTLNRIWMR